MTNKERFLALVADEKTNTLAKNEARIKNRAMLRASQNIAWAVLNKLDHNHLKTEIMPKFVLRCKTDHNYFYESHCYNEISFVNDIDKATKKYKDCDNLNDAEKEFLNSSNQLLHSLFEVYEVPEPKYAIRVVGTELYVSSTLYNVQFSELGFAIELSDESEIEMELDKIKNKVKSKLEIVKLQ
jgi:hypothetical protein